MLGLETEAPKFAVSFLVVAFAAFFFLLLKLKHFLEGSPLDGSGEFIFPVEILEESAHTSQEVVLKRDKTKRMRREYHRKKKRIPYNFTK